MRRTLLRIFAVVSIVGGAGLLCYPYLANVLATQQMNSVLGDYDEALHSLSDQEFAAARQAAVEYDDNLVGQPLHDPFEPGGGYVLPGNYQQILNVNGDSVMGSIEIPKIHVDLPIYHGVGEDALQRGVGHIEYSSTPYGGEGRHSYLSAHRGLPHAVMFTDLNLLENGDIFLIHVLGEVHAYEVDKIEVIKPEEFTSTRPTPGLDLVTLITCTPYGINTERLLVTGHRVPYEPEQVNDAVHVGAVGFQEISLLLACIPPVGLLVFLIWWLVRRNRTHRKLEES